MQNKLNIGKCGEFFVAAELERRGFSVALTMANTKDFDILAISQSSGKQWAIQVKTTPKKGNSWTLHEKNERLIGDHIIYVFVRLNILDNPEYFIVKSKDVADYISAEHRKWLDSPGKKGQQRVDNTRRQFKITDNTVCLDWNDLW